MNLIETMQHLFGENNVLVIDENFDFSTLPGARPEDEVASPVVPE